MSVWTLPINARLVTEGAYTASGYTFPQTGYIPATYTVSLTYTDVNAVAAASATGTKFIVPSGYTINDIRYSPTTLWAGTSVGTVGLTVYAGGTTQAIQNQPMTTGLVQTTGTGVALGFGAPLAADTTIGYTVSVSGTAAQGCSMASLTAGNGFLLISVGVPYNANTRG